MALFKLLRGQESDLANQPLHDGYIWVTKDLKNMWFDYVDETGTLVRKRINAEYADKLRYVQDGATIELDPAEIVTTTYLTTALAEKANASHTHDDQYYTETEIDNKLLEKADASHTHDDKYYTEDEIDTIIENAINTAKADATDKDIVVLAETQNSIDAINATLSGKADADHKHEEYLTEQKQADWNQTDESAVDYIKNKPEIVSDDEFLAWLNDANVVNPVADISGEIYTDNDNEIYVL